MPGIEWDEWWSVGMGGGFVYNLCTPVFAV